MTYTELAGHLGIGVRRLEVAAALWGVSVDDAADVVWSLCKRSKSGLLAEHVKRALLKAQTFDEFKRAAALGREP